MAPALAAALFLAAFTAAAPAVVVDSRMTLEEALAGLPVPDSVRRDLVIFSVRHLGDDGRVHEGQLVAHRRARADLEGVFDSLLRAGFPIRSVVPVARFGHSDPRSMEADNTSAFNWRRVAGQKRLSAHAWGLAIDLNPLRNPQFRHGAIHPAGGRRDLRTPGTLSDTSIAVRLLRARGWVWGGRWPTNKDWQHFEKPLPGRGTPSPVRERLAASTRSSPPSGGASPGGSPSPGAAR